MDRNLKSLRKAADLKQMDIASVLHVSKQTVNKWEMGRAPVARKHWPMLAFVLHVSESELESVMVETLLAACIATQDARPLLNAQTSRLYSAELIASALSRFGGVSIYPKHPSPAKEQPVGFEQEKMICSLRNEIGDLKNKLGDIKIAYAKLKEENAALKVRVEQLSSYSRQPMQEGVDFFVEDEENTKPNASSISSVLNEVK